MGLLELLLRSMQPMNRMQDTMTAPQMTPGMMGGQDMMFQPQPGFAPTMPPNQRVAQAFGGLGSAMQPPPNAQPSRPTVGATLPRPPGLEPQSRMPIDPMSMSLFDRSALMMRDPNTGAFIDPRMLGNV